MSTTTLAVTLDDVVLAALDREAVLMGLPFNQALEQAIKTYSLVNTNWRAGQQLQFINKKGMMVGGVV